MQLDVNMKAIETEMHLNFPTSVQHFAVIRKDKKVSDSIMQWRIFDPDDRIGRLQ